MSTAQSRPYRQLGVFLPVQSRSDHPDRVTREWPRIHNTHLASKGFLLGSLASTIKSTMLVVQSVQTGELLAQKLLRPSGNPDYPGYEYEEPLELRISTWQDTLPSNEFPNDVPLGVLPRDAPFFNKLRFWQHFTPDDELNMPAYSLYFE